MKDVIHALGRSLCECGIGEIAFEHFRVLQMSEVVTFARDEVIGDADTMSASQKFFGEMRSDEAGAAGDEIRSHSDSAAPPSCS